MKKTVCAMVAASILLYTYPSGVAYGKVICSGPQGSISFNDHNGLYVVEEILQPDEIMGMEDAYGPAYSNHIELLGLAFCAPDGLPENIGTYQIYHSDGTEEKLFLNDPNGCLVMTYQQFEAQAMQRIENTDNLKTASIPEPDVLESSEDIYILTVSIPDVYRNDNDQANAYLSAMEKAWVNEPGISYLGEAVVVTEQWANWNYLMVELEASEPDIIVETAASFRFKQHG